jgi:hypothetical protein
VNAYEPPLYPDPDLALGMPWWAVLGAVGAAFGVIGLGTWLVTRSSS